MEIFPHPSKPYFPADNEKLSPRDMVFLRYLMQHDFYASKEPHSSHARVPHIVSFLCIHRRPDSADCKHKRHDAHSHVTPVFRQTPATNPSASQPKAVPPSFAHGSGSYPATQNTSYPTNPSGMSPAYPSSAGVSFPMPSSVVYPGPSSSSACQYSTTSSGTYVP
ncbi:hypothetical protein B0H10DRAFT_2212674 [Mycena sp. CBHHK59/15]|nr:hypothetical protein B0H10DRAFT_2212674 [Mycena sp. CBHHK59/15]